MTVIIITQKAFWNLKLLSLLLSLVFNLPENLNLLHSFNIPESNKYHISSLSSTAYMKSSDTYL